MSAIEQDIIEVDPDTKEMLKVLVSLLCVLLLVNADSRASISTNPRAHNNTEHMIKRFNPVLPLAFQGVYVDTSVPRGAPFKSSLTVPWS